MLMGHWTRFSLPLPVGISLRLLMVFTTEVTLKSEDSFGSAVAVKNTESFSDGSEVDSSNHLDWVLAEAHT